MSLAVRSSCAAALAAVAVFGSGEVARATLVSPNGQVHGCVAKTGVLRVVRVTSKCKRGEQSITFVARGTGPRGPAGPAGAPGPRGPAGPAGAPGTPADPTAVATLQAKVATLEGEVGALQATLAGVTRSGDTLRLSGLNLQLDSGAGSTDAPVNGLGNLFIGDNGSPGVQTGSNNLVIGDGQTFTSYGGLVAGTENAIEAPSASVTGGTNNVASDTFSTVGGGELNAATGNASFIGGGCENVAGSGTIPVGTCSVGGDQSVIGGESGTASGQFSTVAGGQTDLASGSNSVAAGGEYNIASDPFSMTGAGCDNVAGTVSPNSDACDDGGEAVSGGAGVAYSVNDGTGGLVSEIVNESDLSISLSLSPGQCGSATLSIPQAKVGDQALISFPTSPPSAALEFSPPNVTANGTVLDPVCNVGSTSVSYSGHFSIIVLR